MARALRTWAGAPSGPKRQLKDQLIRADERREARLAALQSPPSRSGEPATGRVSELVGVLRERLGALPRRLGWDAGDVTYALLDYAAADIYLRVGTMREYSRLTACRKEPWTVEWIERWVKPGDVLYDIGANVGAYSLVAAKCHRGAIRVLAFEPGFATYASLCENIIANGCSEWVTPLPFVLGAATGLGAFDYYDLRAGAAQHPQDRDGDHAPTSSLHRQPVVTYRLDDLVEGFGLPSPSHIKLDVDGAEGEVLEGAERTLGNLTLRSLMVEVAPELAVDIQACLLKRGFRLHEKYVPTREGHPSVVWYGLFARSGG